MLLAVAATITREQQTPQVEQALIPRDIFPQMQQVGNRLVDQMLAFVDWVRDTLCPVLPEFQVIVESHRLILKEKNDGDRYETKEIAIRCPSFNNLVRELKQQSLSIAEMKEELYEPAMSCALERFEYIANHTTVLIWKNSGAFRAFV